MNAKQRKQARIEARARIRAGEDPQGLVHVQYFPADYWPGRNDIQGLSTALPPDSDLSGYISHYYTLAELAAPWDEGGRRAEAWADAQAAVAGHAPAARKFLFACAERAQEEHSSAGMDRLETILLGEPVTAGTVPERQRFWRFVDLISRGDTPRDLKDDA